MHFPIRFFILLFFLSHISPVSSAEPPLDQLTHYNIQIALDTANHALVGKQNVSYTNRSKQPLSEIVFLLAANHSKEKNPYIHDLYNDAGFWKGWQPKSTIISYVKDGNGNSLEYHLGQAPALLQTYSLEDVYLQITLPTPLQPGEKFELSMGFSTSFPEAKFGDESYWMGVYTWRFAWNPIEVPFSDGEWLSDGVQMPPGHYDLTLTAPSNFIVAAGADIKEVIDETNFSKTYHFKSEVPQLSIPLTMGPGISTIEARLGDINITSLYRSSNTNAPIMMAELAKEIITYYEPRFGDYRYKNLVISETAAPFIAMASDGLILMSEVLYRYKDMFIPGFLNRYLEYVLAHEIAHLWWGIAASPDFARENWLSEAFANYLAISYIEAKYGPDKNVYEYGRGGIAMPILRFIVGDESFRQHTELSYLNVFRLGWDEEISKDPRQIEYGNAIVSRLYDKGYWVLRALENEIGSNKMLLALRITFEEQQGSILTIKEFQQICEDVAQKPLDWFFDQWVFGKAHLDYSVDDVESQRSGDQYITQLTVNKTGDAIATPFVMAKTEDGQVLSKTLDNKLSTQSVKFKTDREIVKVQVDPAQQIPDIYRINNTWPRQIKTHFGLFDNPTDAYSIRYHILPSSVFLPAEGAASAGWGIGVSGGYSPTHQWSLSTSAGFEGDKDYLSTTATFNYLFDAKSSLITLFDATGYDTEEYQDGVYTAQLGHQTTLFESPSLGSSSRILLASNIIQNSLVIIDHDGWYQHVDYQQYAQEYQGALALWRLSYLRDDSVTHAWTNSINLDVAPPAINDSAYFKVDVNSSKSFRLLPNWTFNITASAGYASENVATPEKFDFMLFTSYFGEHYRRSSAAMYTNLDFPIARELYSPMGNFLAFNAIKMNLFSNVGVLGGDWDDPFSTQVGESGAQLKFVFTTLGGFLNFSLNLGVVSPWHMKNTEEEAKETPFISLGLASPL